MRKTVLTLVIVLLLFSLSSCAGSPAEKDRWLAFYDDLENEVVLSSKPCRVAVLLSSYADIWRLAGGEIYVTVGESIERGFADKDALLVDAGAGKQINDELLISYQPDLVIASADVDGQLSCKAALDAAGIPVAYFRVESFSDYLRMLRICTQITGNSEAYGNMGEKIEREISDILSSVSGGSEKKILFLRAGSSVVKAKTANEHFAAAMLKELGTYNIAENAPVLLDGISIEEIISEDPEYIFISTMGDEQAARDNVEAIFAGEAWSSISAIKNKKYIFLPKELFQYKPNAQWADAYRYLAEILYEQEK